MNALPSILRTVVPVLAGWILTVTGAVGLEVDTVTLAGGVTAAVTVAYYVVFRLGELLAARIGWEPGRIIAGLLLGWARPPVYSPPAKPRQLPLDLDGDPAEFVGFFTKATAVPRNRDGIE
ncbi:hypothetical protein ACF1BN_15780 [Streptomyces sp. NPDC014861]|uniref:hypothetical protein n=1 Tax=Streptomyces sp. NPDC014861 TaxID=3364923 RepID=UPI0036F7EF65